MNMFKVVRMSKRGAASAEEFKRSLADAVIAESPVQQIVATFAIPEDGKAPLFDGMVELHFARVEDIRAMFAGPIPAMMRQDEENFVQMDAPAIRFIAVETSQA